MPIDHELVTTLTSSFNRELQAIKELEEQRERARAAKAENTEQLLKTMLEMQATDTKKAEDRRKFLLRFVLGPSGLIAALTGAMVAYVQANQPPEPTPAEQVEKVEQVGSKVETRVTELDQHLKRNDKKIERTVDILLDQQVQISDSTDYIVNKIDAAHPRAANKTEEPASFAAGRKKAKAIKRAREVEESTYDPADPLGDL